MTISQKHKILKYLESKWVEGETQTKGGLQVTDFGRSLTIIELSALTGFKVKTIEKRSISLETIDHIKKTQHDTNGKSHNYVITHNGLSAYYDNYHIKQFWTNFLPWIAIVVSGISILISTVDYLGHEKKIENHELRVNELEEKLKK